MSNGWFYRLYGICGGMFALSGAGIFLLCMTYSKDIFEVSATAALLAGMLLSGVVFVFQIRKGVLRVFCQSNDFLERVIAGDPVKETYEETEASRLEKNLMRFAEMREKEIRDIEAERKRIQQLLSDLSHQTKTPIANILMYSQLMEERTRELPAMNENAKKIDNQATKLKNVIQMMVELSRLENGMITCRSRKENVRDFLVEIIGDFYEKTEAKKIRLELNCPTDIAACFDWKWMREAAGNIVDNGIKYTAAGGLLELSAEEYQMFTRVNVKDTGCGIKEEEIPKLFERFYRSPGAHKEDGLGLGLALTRRIVTEQGGYLKVRSIPGEGSVFSIFLPKE